MFLIQISFSYLKLTDIMLSMLSAENFILNCCYNKCILYEDCMINIIIIFFLIIFSIIRNLTGNYLTKIWQIVAMDLTKHIARSLKPRTRLERGMKASYSMFILLQPCLQFPLIMTILTTMHFQGAHNFEHVSRNLEVLLISIN